MTSLRFHSGAHMNDRMLTIAWMLPAPSSRESYRASSASIATRSRMTFVMMVRLRVASGVEPSRARRTRAVTASSTESRSSRNVRSAGNDLEDQVDDARQHLRQRQDVDEGLGDLGRAAAGTAAAAGRGRVRRSAPEMGAWALRRSEPFRRSAGAGGDRSRHWQSRSSRRRGGSERRRHGLRTRFRRRRIRYRNDGGGPGVLRRLDRIADDIVDSQDDRRRVLEQLVIVREQRRFLDRLVEGERDGATV